MPERGEVLFRQILFIAVGTLTLQGSGVSGQAATRSIMTYLSTHYDQSLSGKSLKLLSPAVRFKAKMH